MILSPVKFEVDSTLNPTKLGRDKISSKKNQGASQKDFGFSDIDLTQNGRKSILFYTNWINRPVE